MPCDGWRATSQSLISIDGLVELGIGIAPSPVWDIRSYFLPSSKEGDGQSAKELGYLGLEAQSMFE